MNIAIVGATGNVGRKTLEVLEKKGLPIENLYLLASSRSTGKKISFKGTTDWKPYNLDRFSKEIQLKDVDEEITKILNGKQIGRVIIRLC